MNIIVCIKQVPDTETVIKINPDGKDIETQGIKYVVNPYDEYAIEEAVRTKEKIPGSTVTAVTAGPARAKESLRTCLAIGADRAVHIIADFSVVGDSHPASTILAEYLKKETFDLVLLGKQAIDDDMAQVGPALASHLDLPFVSLINKFNLSPDNKKVTVHRDIEGGTEVIEVDLPAVLSCQKGLNEPRYPKLPDIMKAKKKEIKDVQLQELGLQLETLLGNQKTTIIKMEYPPKRPPGQVLQGEPPEVVQKLLRLLREEAKVL